MEKETYVKLTSPYVEKAQAAVNEFFKAGQALQVPDPELGQLMFFLQIDVLCFQAVQNNAATIKPEILKEVMSKMVSESIDRHMKNMSQAVAADAAAPLSQ